MSARVVLRRDDAPPQEQYESLFASTGWNAVYQVTGNDLIDCLSRSWCRVSAYCDNRLVGAGRLLSDGVLYAVMFDVVVLPEYQHRGIGTSIVRDLLNRCHDSGIRDILLFSAKGTEAFYRRFGFSPRPANAPGMILRRAPA